MAATTALSASACIALTLGSTVVHPWLGPGALLFVLLKHNVVDRTRFRLPDLVFVLAHAALFLAFVWFVLFSRLARDQLSVLLGFAALWMLLRGFAAPSGYNDFLIVLASLVIVVGTAAAAHGIVPLVITGLFLMVACHALPPIMNRDLDRDRNVVVRLTSKPGRWSVAAGFALHHLALAGLVAGSVAYLAVPRLSRELSGEGPAFDGPDAAAQSLLENRRERRGTGGSGPEPESVSGFPDTVFIGDIGSIKRSNRVAFEGWLTVRGRAYDPPRSEATMLLLRADSWDTYDEGKRAWTRWSGKVTRLPGDGSIGPFVEAPVSWTVRLFGYDGRKLFLPQRTRQVRAPTAPLFLDLAGRVWAEKPVRRYHAEAQLPITRREELARLRPHRGRSRLLSVPAGMRQALRPHYRELLARAPSRPRSILEATELIRRYFETGRFRYTLDLPAGLPAGTDPILAFLERKEGHCELFASAGCLFLRMMGIPARLAGGVRCAARIDTGHYRARFRNAHAWVEISCRGVGFVAIDFTPADSSAAAAGGGPGGAEGAGGVDGRGDGGARPLDWRDPFRYGPDEQRLLLRRIRDHGGGLVLGLALLAVLFAILLGVRRRRPKARRRPVARAPRRVRRSIAFYMDWLKACVERGHRRGRRQTAREFLESLPAELAEEGRAVTRRYEEIRFGGA